MEIKFFLIAALLLSASTTGLLATYSVRHFTTAGARSYAWLLGCITIYSAGYALELYHTDLDGILVASSIQYLGIPFLPVFWLMVATRYAGYGRKLPPYAYLPLFAIPLTTMLLHFTDAHHHLVYKAVALNESGPFPLLSITRGPWYYVQTVFTYICFLTGNFLFIRMAFKTVGPHRKQAVALAAISLLPWVADIIYQQGLSPFGIDLAPFAFTIVGPGLAWSVFRLRIFDFVPIARDTIFDFMRDPVMVFDDTGRLVDCNRSATSLIKNVNRQAIGTHAAQIFKDHADLAKAVVTHSSGSRDVLIRNGETVRICELSTIPMYTRLHKVAGKILILHDVTEQRELMDRLRDQATLDGLTGIYNHRHLMVLCQNEVDRARRHGHPLTLLLADLDFFKQINDTHGHQAGDKVLREVAAVFKRNLRSSDVLGRYGGEEFAVLLPQTPPEFGKELADRIRRDLARVKIRFEDLEISVTASFGVAGGYLDQNGDTSLATLFRHADSMLYRAKDKGRNRVIKEDEDNG